VLKPKRVKPSAAASPAAPADVLAESIGSWVARQTAKPLVFTLEHHYTQRGLSLDLLKGVDRQLADLVVSAAEKTDCFVHLAQVSRHLLQFADDGSFGQGYSHHYRTPRRAIEIGETYEDDLSGTQWTDVRGRKQPWVDIAFDLSAIVSSVPIDDWKPTSEEFEGYTGNAGNTLDRWYHRSAIVIWHRDHHFDVVASSGAIDSIPLFCSMAAELTRTPRKRLEEARIDCIRFARAIIARWPQHTIGYGHPATREKSPYDDFPEHLLTLHDRDTIAMFLTKLAEHDQSLRLSSFVVAACREFGWSAFVQELKRLISSRPNMHGRQETPFRDVEWLSAFCCDKSADPDKSALARELCALAVERFREPRPPRPTYYSPHLRRETSVSETSLPLLLKALAASGRDEDLSHVIHFVQESPDEFSLDDCQVPCLKSLIPWSQKQFGLVHPQLVSWLISVRQDEDHVAWRRSAAIHSPRLGSRRTFQCHGRSFAAIPGRCPAPCGTAPWSRGRPDGGTACGLRAAEHRRSPVLPGAIPPLAASAPAAWAWSGHLHFLSTDELRLELGFAVLKQHPDDLGQVLLQLVERFPLRMGTGKARNVADKQARVRTALDYGRKSSHIHLENFIAARLTQHRAKPSGAWPVCCSDWFGEFFDRALRDYDLVQNLDQRECRDRKRIGLALMKPCNSGAARMA
jgi:hypothetical protein